MLQSSIKSALTEVAMFILQFHQHRSRITPGDRYDVLYQVISSSQALMLPALGVCGSVETNNYICHRIENLLSGNCHRKIKKTIFYHWKFHMSKLQEYYDCRFELFSGTGRCHMFSIAKNVYSQTAVEGFNRDQ